MKSSRLAYRKYPHGIARRGAVDRGGDVTSVKRSKRLYRQAENHDGDLDRDHDKIACDRA